MQSTVAVDGITGRDIWDFLLTCTDEEYQRWWPGTHLQLHMVRPGTNHIGDVMYMDEYIGKRRLRMTGIVAEAVPGKKIVWRVTRPVPLPVSLTLDLADGEDGVVVRHTIHAGFNGAGRVLDPLFRLYFSHRLAAMDRHVKTEFPLLRDHLVRMRRDRRRDR
jgi:hypothetical protein